MRRVVGFLIRAAHLTRPQIALQAAAYTLLGAHLGPGLTLEAAGRLSLGAFVVALTVSFGFVVNDVADLEVDRLTKPYRPLPAGVFTPAEAVRFAGCLAAVIIAVAATLPAALFLIACGNLVLAALYAFVLKGTVLLGNLAVATLNSSILVFGAIAGGSLTPLVMAVAAMSLLYTLGQEVLYTVDDREGDQMAGLVTTAVFLGVERSLRLFHGLMLLAMLAALAPLWLGAPWALYLPSLLLFTIGPVLLRVLPLTWGGSAVGVRRACAAVKLVRLTSLIPLILLHGVG